MDKNASNDTKEFVETWGWKIMSIAPIGSLALFLQNNSSVSSAIFFSLGYSIVFGIMMIIIHYANEARWAKERMDGYIDVLTDSQSDWDAKKLSIRVYSKRKIDLSNVYIELVNYSFWKDGNDHNLFAQDEKTVSQIPFRKQLFHGDGKRIMVDFVDGIKNPSGDMIQQNERFYGDKIDFVIKIFGKFSDGKYDFTEYYKGEFKYIFSTAEDGEEEVIRGDGEVRKAAQITWEPEYAKKLERISEKEFLQL